MHSHVWGHLATMVQRQKATLDAVSEPNPELVAEAKRAGVGDDLFFPDYSKMLDEAKPDLVWAFVENNRHLEMAKEWAPRHINVIFEKPLASSYEDATQIQELAQKYVIRVMTNYQMAWAIELHRRRSCRPWGTGNGISSARSGWTWRTRIRRPA